MPLIGDIRRWTKRLCNAVLTPLVGRYCHACGRRAVMLHRRVLGSELIEAWELSPAWAKAFDQREGCACLACGNSLRTRQMAEVLIREFNPALRLNLRSLAELTREPAFGQLDVAEINACGLLHQFLQGLPRLRHSEFGSTTEGVRSEDLCNLSYADGSFDLVLTSETLEHVPDVEAALREVRRILKPNGRHVFTTPVVWDRPKTRRRAVLENGEVKHLLPPSYHGPRGQKNRDYLVFYEFGADVEDLVRSAGFELSIYRDPINPAVATMVATRPA